MNQQRQTARLGESYWARLERARALVKAGKVDDSNKIIRELWRELDFQHNSHAAKRAHILERFARVYSLDCDVIKMSSIGTAKKGDSLDDYVSTVLPGVSLVTCCMNRNDNLLKALPSWLACGEITEIVVVDWSSDLPVIESLRRSGFTDSRITVIRVDGENRWVLSYAFNVGFRAAQFDRILKVDADIVLDSQFFVRNILEAGCFISGDWRIADEGQEYINGFFYVYRKDLMQIKGFNEYITTYGWDDDDIYNRLESINLIRKRVDPKTIFHLPHEDAQRFASTPSPPQNGWDELAQNPKFKIRVNRFIANAMPVWDNRRNMLPFEITETGDRYLYINRKGAPVHYVPMHIREDGAYYAARELLSWALGPRVFDLTKANLDRLLSVKPFDLISKLDIEIVLAGVGPEFRLAKRYLLVELSVDPSSVNGSCISLMERLVVAYAQRFGLPLILFSVDWVQWKNEWKTADAVAHPWMLRRAGDCSIASPFDIVSQQHPSLKEHVRIKLDRHFIEETEGLVRQSTCAPMPAVSVRRPKVYIDAQHGLGNRLRAIASAAAIAKGADRDLVIVWEPDHHCDCSFHDLFKYQGPVIEESFLSDAKRRGALVYNYMEIEKDAKKDAAIELDTAKDLYVRSAYVLKGGLTSWETENEFLRALNPADAVTGLISRVRQPNALGVHVRMEAGKGLDHNSYDRRENWTDEGHEQLHYWREQSHYSRFLRRISELGWSRQSGTIFLAADRPEIYDEFISQYGDCVTYLQRDIFDRSAQQLQYALADVLLLSRCQKFIGSTWSSFSELALRLSEGFKSIEMSGRDF